MVGSSVSFSSYDFRIISFQYYFALLYSLKFWKTEKDIHKHDSGSFGIPSDFGSDHSDI